MKAGWTQFAVNNPAALISGFNPKRAFDGNLGVGNGENVAFFALVTPDSRYYAVKLGRQGMTSKFRIIQVLEVAPTIGNALQTIFT